jgi:hypothetical protein
MDGDLGHAISTYEAHSRRPTDTRMRKADSRWVMRLLKQGSIPPRPLPARLGLRPVRVGAVGDQFANPEAS